MTKKTNSKQYYSDLELMTWVDREQSIDAGKLKSDDIKTAESFIQTRRLLERVAKAAAAFQEAANIKNS